MFKRFCLISLMCLHALSWGGVTPASQAAYSNPKLSLTQFFGATLQSLVTKTLEIDAVSVYSSKSVLQGLRKFLPTVYQKGTASGSRICPKLPSYKIGDFAQGGVVIWVTEDGEHGLVAAIEDAELEGAYILAWGPTNVTTNATANASLPFTYTDLNDPAENYSGYQNQQKVKSLDTNFSNYPAFAAAADYTYTMDGVTYSDWFLPCSSELDMMYVIRTKIDAIAQDNGGDQFGNKVYWSSREVAFNNRAWYLIFSSGTQSNIGKDNTYAVRCLRAF